MHSSRLCRGILAAVFMLAPAAAFAQAGGSDWPNIVAAAKKEGKVQLYTAQPIPVVVRLVEGSKKAYPEIVVEYQRGPSGPALSKIEQERASGSDGADVWVSTEFGWFIPRAREGRLLKPVGPAAAKWPAQFLREGSVIVPAREPFVIL